MEALLLRRFLPQLLPHVHQPSSAASTRRASLAALRHLPLPRQRCALTETPAETPAAPAARCARLQCHSRQPYAPLPAPPRLLPLGQLVQRARPLQQNALASATPGEHPAPPRCLGAPPRPPPVPPRRACAYRPTPAARPLMRLPPPPAPLHVLRAAPPSASADA